MLEVIAGEEINHRQESAQVQERTVTITVLLYWIIKPNKNGKHLIIVVEPEIGYKRKVERQGLSRLYPFISFPNKPTFKFYPGDYNCSTNVILFDTQASRLDAR